MPLGGGGLARGKKGFTEAIPADPKNTDFVGFPAFFSGKFSSAAGGVPPDNSETMAVLRLGLWRGKRSALRLQVARKCACVGKRLWVGRGVNFDEGQQQHAKSPLGSSAFPLATRSFCL